MKKQFYKMMLLQLGIFLSYDFAFVYFHYPVLLFIATVFHAIALILFSVFYFRKKDAMKAFTFLIPFFVVLLIGMGSCGGFIAMGGAGSMEFAHEKRDSIRHEREQKKLENERKMGHDPNSHKGQKESGIPGRRYKWLKKKPK